MTNWRAAVEEITVAPTVARQQDLSTEYGVVVPKFPNPLESLHFDKFSQIPVDIFHHDPIVSRLVSLIK